MSKLKGIMAGEYGKSITISLVDNNGDAVDISSYTSVTVEISGQNKKFSKTATLVGGGTGGQISFNFDEGEIHKQGTWKGQVYLYKTGELAKSAVFNIEVGEGLT